MMKFQLIDACVRALLSNEKVRTGAVDSTCSVLDIVGLPDRDLFSTEDAVWFKTSLHQGILQPEKSWRPKLWAPLFER